MNTSKKKTRATSYSKKLIRYNGYWLLLRIMIGIAFALSNVAIGQLNRSMYDNAILAGESQMLMKLGGQYLLAFGAFIIFYTVQEIITIYINERSAARLRKDCYSSYLKLAFPTLEKYKSGDILTRMTSDVDNMKPMAGVVWTDIINGILMLAVLLLWMFSVNATLAAMLLAAPLLFCFLIMFFGTKMYQISQMLQKYKVDTNHLLGQTVSGAHTIKLHLLKDLATQKFSQSLSSLAKSAIKQDVVNAKMQSVWNLVIVPYQAVFFMISGILYIKNGTPSIGTILAFSNFAAFLINPLMSLLGSLSNIGGMIPSRQRVMEIIDGAEDSEELNKMADADGAAYVNRDIKLHNVQFSYPSGEQILHDISFTAPKHKTTVILGHSGAGKSTIAKLILGLYEPDSGEILLEQQNPSSKKAKDSSVKIAYLEQQPFLFETTVLENILLGQPDTDAKRLKEAISHAHVQKVIDRLPEKLNTVLDEKIPLSGGEKQRLALARCFIRNADVYLLDEPTSAIDENTTKDLFQCFKEYYKDKTKIVITHNQNLLKYADYCVILEKGCVQYTGTVDKMPSKLFTTDYMTDSIW